MNKWFVLNQMNYVCILIKSGHTITRIGCPPFAGAYSLKGNVNVNGSKASDDIFFHS